MPKNSQTLAQNLNDEALVAIVDLHLDSVVVEVAVVVEDEEILAAAEEILEVLVEALSVVDQALVAVGLAIVAVEAGRLVAALLVVRLAIVEVADMVV